MRSLNSVDDPIQRAAEALAKIAGDAEQDAWKRYVPTVRTVLEALNDPTATMIDAGNEAMRGAWADRGLGAPPVAGDAAVAASWEAMLDRLLGHV
jgi:hypothetical protein